MPQPMQEETRDIRQMGRGDGSAVEPPRSSASPLDPRLPSRGDSAQDWDRGTLPKLWSLSRVPASCQYGTLLLWEETQVQEVGTVVVTNRPDEKREGEEQVRTAREQT